MQIRAVVFLRESERALYSAAKNRILVEGIECGTRRCLGSLFSGCEVGGGWRGVGWMDGSTTEMVRGFVSIVPHFLSGKLLGIECN